MLQEIIKQATQRFATNSATSDRLGWWLLRAHSSERWMQFEWAYSLSQELKDSFFVSCEHDRVDVALFDKKNEIKWPIWKNTPTIGFELKWLGNWYNAGRAEGVAIDVNKVNTSTYPAAAIAFWLKADADPTFKEYGWIQKQLDKGIGADDSGFHASLVQATEREPDFKFTVAIAPPNGIRSLELHTFCYFNKLAIA